MDKIKIKDVPPSATFEINGLNYESAKKIRDFLLSEIPVTCIDFVVIYENTTSMEDEVLAQRLGLVALYEDAFPEDFEVFPSLDFSSTLNIKNSKSRRMIYATDLTPPTGVDLNTNSIFTKIPLLTIDKGESLHLDVTFRRAKRSDENSHAKHSIVNVVYYRNKRKGMEELEDRDTYSFYFDSNKGLPVEKIIGILRDNLENILER